MTTEGIIFLIGALVVTALVLGLPFLRREGRVGVTDRERLNLLAAYERAVVTARDMDEDYQMGKLSQTDYEAERSKWSAQGAAILQQIESINGGNGKSSHQRERRA